MVHSLPSALVIDQGRRVLLRLYGRFYDLTQDALRSALGLPEGPPGLGITINHDRLQFEFLADHQTAEMRANQLQRRISKRFAEKP